MPGITAALEAEVEATRFVFDEVAAGRPLPVAEAQAVAHALVLETRTGPTHPVQASSERPEDYMAVHAVNVAVLALTLAESMHLSGAAVRLVALAGLLHDIGMTRMPAEVLLRKGPIDDAERRRLQTHPIEGARVIIAADAGMELAAIVAFEHHLRLDGTGYPVVEPHRPPHRVSRIVQLCGIWHALRTPRPYRDAWPAEIILSYFSERSGFDIDPAVSTAFIAMIRRTMAEAV